MGFIGIMLEYIYLIYTIYIAIRINKNYGLITLGGLAVILLLGYITRRSWLRCLKMKNTGSIRTENKKRYYFLVGEAVWAILLVYDFLFLDTIPAFFFWKTSGNKSLVLAIIVLGCLAVYSIVDTKLDIVITREGKPPHWFWRITPVSAVAAAATLIFYDKIVTMGDLFSSGAYLQALFLLELVFNLGIRYFRNRRKSCL